MNIQIQKLQLLTFFVCFCFLKCRKIELQTKHNNKIQETIVAK